MRGARGTPQLFDLDRDPREQRNIAGEQASALRRLRTALDAFLTSIAEVEALAAEDQVAFPAALSLARLGAPGAGPDVIPLLADARAPVRVAAARTLGELRVVQAAPALDRLRRADPDLSVRAEAALSALSLGSLEAAEDVRPLLSLAEDGDGLSLPRRAGLALAGLHDAAALPVLISLAQDERADEGDRLRAVHALADLGSQSAIDSLIALLPNVRLRAPVAEALGQLGGGRARSALARVLVSERYQEARSAEARALQRLGHPRTAALVTHFLGMETSIPDGVRMLLELGALGTPPAFGAALTSESVRRGAWRCDAQGCKPGLGAAVELPARGLRAGPVRVTWLVRGEVGSVVTLDGVQFKLKAAEEQLSFERDGRAARRFAVGATDAASIVAVCVTPTVPEIPAPAPEPWDPAAPLPAAP